MATWKIDPSHSEIGFKVKHLVISTVSGKFTSFEGSIESSKDDFTDGKIKFTGDVNSINTGNEQRDGHLKSADFFDAANHSKITFVSTGIKKTGETDYKVSGNLTIRGITKPIDLDVEFGGIQKDFSDNDVAGFELRGKIRRLEFGLHWNAATEAGGIIVSDEVKLVVNVEVVKQKNLEKMSNSKLEASSF
jgi:polyisoprenoid-binding protein YceI